MDTQQVSQPSVERRRRVGASGSFGRGSVSSGSKNVPDHRFSRSKYILWRDRYILGPQLEGTRQFPAIERELDRVFKSLSRLPPGELQLSAACFQTCREILRNQGRPLPRPSSRFSNSFLRPGGWRLAGLLAAGGSLARGWRLAAGGWRRQAAGWKPEAGGWRLAVGDWGLGTSHWWRLEAGGWRLEAEGWRLEAGSWRLEAGGWRLEARDWRLETVGWRLTGGRRLDGGGWGLEAGGCRMQEMQHCRMKDEGSRMWGEG